MDINSQFNEILDEINERRENASMTKEELHEVFHHTSFVYVPDLMIVMLFVAGYVYIKRLVVALEA